MARLFAFFISLLISISEAFAVDRLEVGVRIDDDKSIIEGVGGRD
jgi:hypothetical protein